MLALWKRVVRILFWEYERGTLPYDLLVLGIVLFVFFTPRTWFNDQPQPGQVIHTAQVLLMSEDPATHIKIFRIDANLVPAPQGLPQLERRAHDLLARNVEELKSRNFQILRIDRVLGDDGAVIHYDVRVRP